MMSKETTPVTIALTAVALFLLAVTPALGAKDDKQSSPGKVKTATVATNTSADNQFVTVTAECPKGTKVVGGGFSAGTSGSTDFHIITESRRGGPKSWTVSAFRNDTGGAGPVLPVTAEAYCRSGFGKISETSATAPTFPSGTNPIKPEAPCALGKTVVGGGFSYLPKNFTNVNLYLYMNRPIGKVGWATAAVAPFGDNASGTAFAYCQKRKPLAQRSGVGQLPPADGSAASADSAACPGKRSATSGGFQAPVLYAGNFAIWVESRRAEKSWHVSVINGLSVEPPGLFTSYALCS